MHSWAEHTGELELRIRAPSRRAVFEEGLEAMRTLFDVDGGEPLPPRRVSLEARDGAALLADWLGELAYLAEGGFVPLRLASLELGERSLEAVVEGVEGSPRHLVKAATYHRLALERARSGWRASVVLDV